MTGAFVGLDIGVVEKRLAVFDAGKGVADVRLPGADGFYFAAFQLNPRLETLENVKIAQRLAIKYRLGRHGQRFRNAILLAVGRFLDLLEGQLTRNDFLERDIGQRSAGAGFDQGTMSETELTDTLGNDVDQELLIRDDLGRFL